MHESFLKISDPRLLWANRELLKHSTTDSDDIADFCCISSVHTDNSIFHSRPTTKSDQLIEGYRPPRYGRAALFSISKGPNPETFDVKGVGAPLDWRPSPCIHETGLLSIAEAVHELIMNKLVKTVLERLELKAETNYNYAIMANGITGKSPVFSRQTEDESFCALVRNYSGPRESIISVYNEDKVAELLEIEMCLQRHGITSCNPEFGISISRKTANTIAVHRNNDVKFINRMSENFAYFDEMLVDNRTDNISHPFPNIQMATKAGTSQIVDFGHYRLRRQSDSESFLLRLRGSPFEIGPIVNQNSCKVVDYKTVRELGSDLFTSDVVREAQKRYNLLDFERSTCPNDQLINCIYYVTYILEESRSIAERQRNIDGLIDAICSIVLNQLVGLYEM